MHTPILAPLSTFFAILLLVASPLGALAGAPRHAVTRHPVANAPATISFGREGGNIRPYAVTIKPDGTLAANGPVTVRHTPLTKNAVQGLLKLARAEHFFKMATFTQCPGSLPDFAAAYIHIQTGTQDRKVDVRGGCNATFSQLFDVLAASAGISQ